MAAEPHFRDPLESPRLPGWPFIILVAGVLSFLTVSLGSLWGIFVYNEPDRVPLPAQVPPQPRLQSNPPAELSKILSAQRARLSGYHWVDRANGLVAIPIDRAMAIIAARGTDAYAPIPGAPKAPAPNIPGILENLRTPPAPQAPVPRPDQPPSKP